MTKYGTMIKRHPADPRSRRGLITAGCFFLASGIVCGMVILRTSPVGAEPTNAHLAIMAGIVAAGICWIGAYAKTRK